MQSLYVTKCLLIDGVCLQDVSISYDMICQNSGLILYLPLQRPGLGGSTAGWMLPAVETS